MSVAVALFIPSIGSLLLGLDWDMALNESSTHDNMISEHPIEDPTRSFVMDYNRERPAGLSIKLAVSSNPVVADFGDVGAIRLTLLYENLLALKAEQTVKPSAFFDVFTGVRIYRNMAIKSVKMVRNSADVNECIFDIELMEFRFAKSPRQTQRTYLMEANEGALSNTAETLVAEIDRPIVEATKTRSFPRLGRPTLSQNALMGVALSAGGANVLRLLT